MRTTKIVTALGAVLAVAGGLGVTAGPAPSRAATVASPWGQTDYNAAQSRANLTETTLTRASVGKVQHLRSVRAPAEPPNSEGCYRYPRVITPVLTGRRVYAVANGRLSKYSAATGRLIWRRTTNPDAGYWALSVARGLVVVGELDCTSVSDPNGYIQAFSASTGARVWSRLISPDGGALVQMVVSGGYVAAAGYSVGTGGVVSVLKLATGASVWYRVTRPCNNGSAVLVEAKLVISYNCPWSGGEKLTANNLATGKLAWSRSGVWQMQRGDTDARAGRHLYATNPRGTVVSLNPLTGRTQYSLAGADRVLAVDGTRAYATCGSLGVCAYSENSGNRRWSTQPGFTPALAAEAGGLLYLDRGSVLNTGTGQSAATLWVRKTASSLVVGDGRIAAVTNPAVLDLYGLPEP